MARPVSIATVHFFKAETGLPRREDALEQWRRAEARFDDTGMDLIVACEGMESIAQRVEEAEDLDHPGPMIELYAAAARRNRCTVVGSAKIKEAGAVYNAQVVLGPDGNVLGRYRKTYLTQSEVTAGMSPGSGAEVIETPAGRLGGVICFDLNFPELRSAYRALSPDILVFSSMYHGGHVQQSWAYETQSFFVGACKDVLSEIRDPLGRVLSSATAYSHVAFARVNLDRMIVHLDGHLDLFGDLLRRYKDGIRIDTAPDLGVALLTCESDSLTMAELARRHSILSLNDYLGPARSRIR
ncbi:MAG: carbon-nitrogen hydrolase family protein [Kiritimatiellia bacterium]|nr:carbon-nitrogen hydrolase family protein [Kiritimatiellia bacterium]